MDAAAAVAVRRGIAGASVDEVAEQAGFTKGAVYANFLLVTIAGDRMTVRAIGESIDSIVDIERFDVDGHRVSGPIVVPSS